MKKIAIVTNTSWNILNFRSSLVNEIKKHYEVLLVAPRDDYSDRIEQLAPTVFLENLSRKGTNPIKDLQLTKELMTVYKKHQVDLALHFTIKPNIYGTLAAKMAGVPSIAVVTGLGYTFLSTGITAKVAKRLYKEAFKRNNLTVFQNQDDRNLFMELGLVSEGRSRVINGSGIDVEAFQPMPRTDWYNGFHFLFIGRLLYDKGVRELLAAFTEQFAGNNDVFLHIVGDIDKENPSAYSEEELNQVLVKHPNIIYHGRVNPVQTLVANSHCVVLPSYREGVPRVMLEALAMAKPVITTDVAGCKETVVDKQNGFLVSAQNHEELGQKMLEMTKITDDNRKKMGDFGRSMAVDKFASSVINQEFIKELQRVASV